MAKNSIRDYSATSSLNTDVQSVDISEGCAASGINNAIREVMADLKDVSSGTIALETPSADQLNVDNIRIDGNTISSTDTNGDITLDPDGTGNLIVSSGNVGIGTSSPSYKMALEDSSNFAIHLLKTGSNDGWVRNIGTMDIAAASGGGGGQVITFSTGANYAGLTERMRIDGTGNVLVNGTTVRAKHTVSRSDASSYNYASISVSNQPDHFVFYTDSTVTGSITRSGGTGVNYNTSSDHRLKENVADMTGAIDRVKALAPKRFNFIADADTTVDGFLAHEAQAVVPEAVTGTKDAMRDEEYEVTPAVLDDDGNVVTEAVMGTRSVPDYQGIDQSKLVPLLTGALQEAIAKIEALETRIEALENA